MLTGDRGSWGCIIFWRRDQLHACSVFELPVVARLCARVDGIFVYVMQIRQKSSCPRPI